MGRVFRQEGRSFRSRKGILIRDILNTLRRRGVSNAVLKVRSPGNQGSWVKTDRRGNFLIHLDHVIPQEPAVGLWHSVHLKLYRPRDTGAEARGEIFVPPQAARFGVISDIDDTVVFTGVSNKLMMIWRLFMQKAQSRIAFPGVAAFYRALHQGASGGEMNPMLYVSRSPWSIYEILDEFFKLHRIPVGPILFLRDWGLTCYRPFTQRAKRHKIALIDRIFAIYRDLPLILIGDSGQRDPEIYADVVRKHPGRVLSIYIRHIDGNRGRYRAIENLAREVSITGSKLLLAADSFSMAEHAVEHGFISPAALWEISRDQRQGTAHA